MSKAPDYGGTVTTLFDNIKPIDTDPQPVKIPVRASFSDLSAASTSASTRASSWEDGYDDMAEASSPAGSPVIAGGGSAVVQAEEDPTPGFSNHDKMKLENLIRLHIHCISVSNAPPAELVPAPPGLVPDKLLREMRQSQGSAAPEATPPAPMDPSSLDVPPAPENMYPHRRKATVLSGSISFGSIGHPISCAGPCKYLSMKSRGCKDGPACDRCHLCVWPRDNRRQQGVEVAAQARSGVATPTPGERTGAPLAPKAKPAAQAPEVYPPPPQPAAKRSPELTGDRIEWTNQDLEKMSPGSVNHPHGCAGACKYFRKPRGCKDGTSCNRCHVCEWQAPPRRGAQAVTVAAVNEAVGGAAAEAGSAQAMIPL